jgi:outer membrane protein OmpA-like peptidoglycan-associated protein
MKKAIFLLLLTVPVYGFTQSAVADRFKQKVKARIEQRVDEGMDKTIDKAEEEITKAPKKANGNSENEEKPAPASVDKKPETPNATSFKSYSRYDFVPGENVLYAEDFSQDVLGEFPVKWATSNRGEAVTIESTSNKWMRMFIGEFVSPQIKNLPENFTVEFDMFLTYANSELQDFGSGFPKFELQLLQLSGTSESARKYAQGSEGEKAKVGLMLQPAYEDRSTIYIQSYFDQSMYFEGGNKELHTFSKHYRKPFHVAIWVQKQRLRVWINEEKIYDVPQAIAPQASFNHIGFWTADNSEEENIGVYVSNLKVAEGTPDMRSKLITEGKLVTHGILFAVGSDKIKPESAGVLKEIASVLKQAPTIKVKVVGHTDSDGDEAKNLDLSKRRSAAVKAALVQEWGIDAARLETDGLGESKPVADNTTKEGKAQNRRVEFIKQ